MKIHFVSLGCDKNLVDSERMIASCAAAGYEFTDEPESAEVIVINSCCFIDSAKEESINELLGMAEYKTQGSCICSALLKYIKPEPSHALERISEVDFTQCLHLLTLYIGKDRCEGFLDVIRLKNVIIELKQGSVHHDVKYMIRI